MSEKTKTHWLSSPNKNYLGHWDLPESGELVLTIKSAKWEAVKDPVSNKTESKRVVRWEENYKPLICNQTNSQSIVDSTGVKWMEDCAGQKICLFIDKILDRRTKENIECIRIRRQNPYTLEALKSIFDKKESVISDKKMIDRIKSIIDKKESSSYAKAIGYIKSL